MGQAALHHKQYYRGSCSLAVLSTKRFNGPEGVCKGHNSYPRVRHWVRKFNGQVSRGNSIRAGIDYLINNAGAIIVPSGNSLDLDGEALAKAISVNVYGPAKLVIELLLHLTSGSVVVNVSSDLGSISAARGPKDAPPPSSRYPTYSISKAALNMLTVHQAGDLKDKGVTVIALHPGWVQTDMGGSSATLKPDESIRGMRNLIEQIDLSATGRFYQYDGREHEW